MSDHDAVLLLQLINARASLDPLLARGFRYSQIAKMMRAAIEEGLISETDEGLTLTAEGLTTMRTAPTKERPRRDGGWISPETESRIEQRPDNAVYLPKESRSLQEP